ncbi:hypothetical protein BC829DRAFT_475298 [Chytridium lagenaria]|nr:hypothetical protein BC829DRAFT_475298 [Chytridium lagenaria]
MGSAAGRPTSAFGADDPSHIVETTNTVASRETDTFITQRGGKIIQGNHLYVPVNQNEVLIKKKEMNTVQGNLEKKRIEFAKRMEECREKQEELRAKQKQIRDRVTKFEKFLKENDAKRQRANLKAQSEKKLREQKEQELALLLHTLGDEQGKSENTLRLINVNEPHINDILMRHKTLVETNEDLIRMLQQSQDTIEKEATALAELIKEKNDLILVYNSKLGMQQKRLDKLKLESAYTEQKLEERDNTGKERGTTLTNTKPAFVVTVTANDSNIGNNPRPSNVNPNPTGLGQLPAALTTLNSYTSNPLPGTRDSDNSIRSLTEKLHIIQERLLDLQHITSKAEQSIAQEKAERARKQAALAAEIAAAKA